MASAFPTDPSAWTLDDIRRAASRSEWDDLEFKQSYSSNLTKELTAFANTSGGWLLVGVRDRGDGDSRLVGVETSAPQPLDAELVKIQPPLRLVPPAFHRLPSGAFIAIARVEQGRAKPYQAENGIFYRRSGSSSVPMNRREVFDAMVTDVGLRGKARQLLTILVGFRDLSLRAANAPTYRNSPYLFERVDARLIGALTSEIHPVIGSADGLLEELHRVAQLADGFNGLMDHAEALRREVNPISIGFLSPQNDGLPDSKGEKLCPKLDALFRAAGLQARHEVIERVAGALAAAASLGPVTFRSERQVFGIA